MDHEFDAGYWETHWQERPGGPGLPPNPHLVAETAALRPGTALDAGCGEGAEATWLASRGWRVTAADVSAEALARAAARAGESPVTWVQADLSSWTPAEQYDLVTTHYAHSAMPQLEFYRRLADWVAPGGTLLVVGHLHGGHAHGGHGHGQDDGEPPAEASVTAASTAAVLDPAGWDVVTADERVRVAAGRELRDVVVRAMREP